LDDYVKTEVISTSMKLGCITERWLLDHASALLPDDPYIAVLPPPTKSAMLSSEASARSVVRPGVLDEVKASDGAADSKTDKPDGRLTEYATKVGNRGKL
jgi:hypothetical protein